MELHTGFVSTILEVVELRLFEHLKAKNEMEEPSAESNSNQGRQYASKLLVFGKNCTSF